MKKGILVLAAMISVAAANANPVEKAANRYSLDQLFAVQTLLRVKLDGNEVCAQEFAGVAQTALASMPQLLEAEVKARLNSMKEKGALVPYLSNVKRQKECKMKCRCDLYDLALEKMGSVVTETRRPLKPAQYQMCAKANENWICKGPVLRALITEVKKATE